MQMGIAEKSLISILKSTSPKSTKIELVQIKWHGKVGTEFTT